MEREKVIDVLKELRDDRNEFTDNRTKGIVYGLEKAIQLLTDDDYAQRMFRIYVKGKGEN